MKSSVFAALVLLAVQPSFAKTFTCEDSFKSGIVRIEAQRTEVSAQQESLHQAILTPESQRTDKDPRWLARFRSAAKNPVTMRLQAELETVKAESARLDAQAELFLSVEALRDQFLETKTNDDDLGPGISAQVSNSIVHDLIALEDSASLEGVSLSEINKLKKRREALLKEIETFSGPKGLERNAVVYNRVVAPFARNLTDFRSEATRFMKRSVPEFSTVILKDLVDAGLISKEAVLKKFEEIDKNAIARRNGLRDEYVAMLTRTAVKHGLSTDEVLNQFLAIDQGVKAESKGRFTLYDLEVAVLTEISLSLGKTAEQATSLVLEYDQLGRTRKGRNWSHLNDQGIVVLVELSLRNPKLDKEKVIADLFALVDAKASSSDLTLALMTRAGQMSKVEAAAIHEQFEILKAEMLDQLKVANMDVEFAKLVDIAVATKTDPKKIVSIIKQISELSGGRMNLTQVRAVLAPVAVALSAKPNDFFPVDSEMRALIYKVNHSTAQQLDDLVEKSSSSSSWTSSQNAFASSSSNDAIGSIGIGLVMDLSSGTMHVGTSINLGGGIGLDLSDNSMTFGGGGGVSFEF